MGKTKNNKKSKSKKKDGLFEFAKDNLLYLSILSVFFIGSLAVSLTLRRAENVTSNYEFVHEVLGYSVETYSDVPTLKDDFEYYPTLTAQGVLAVDLDSSVTLYEKSPDEKLLPASTVKMMTAVVALEHMDLDRVITVDAPNVVGQKVKLADGEKITVRELIHTLLIFSANDTSEVLANEFLGGRDVFVEVMNTKAHLLRMKNTNYTNPSGLDGDTQKTTARDLSILARYAMENPLFADIVGTSLYTAESVDGKFAHRMRNTNELLGVVDGVKGIKTGWTENARENLVTFIDRDGKKIIIVVLGSQDRFGETTTLIEWIYNNYEWEMVGPGI